MAVIPAPNFASPAFKRDPFPFYARLRAEEPIYHTVFNKQSMWLITRYDDAVRVLKDEQFAKDRFSVLSADQQRKQPWMPKFLLPLSRNMLDVDGADHDRLRALVHKAFTPRLIERLRDRIQTLADDLLDRALSKGKLELISQYALPLPLTIIAELLGVPVQHRTRFQRWSQRVVAVSDVKSMLVAVPALWQFMRYSRKLIDLRRADPQDDLISALVQAEEAGDKLNSDELLAMIILLLIAGHETTVNLIASGTLTLLEHPDQLDLLRRNPPLIKTAVEELLRFAPPVEMATERFARTNITTGDVTIPAGDTVLVVISSANRDDAQFAQPDVLDLARDPNRHLSFGQGIHYCLGAPLARLEGQIALTTLVQRLPDLRLAQPSSNLAWRRGMILRGLERLPLLPA